MSSVLGCRFLPSTYSTYLDKIWTENIKLDLQCLENIIKINEIQEVFFFSPRNLSHIISQMLEISELCWNHFLVEKFTLTKETFTTVDTEIWVLKRQQSLLLDYLKLKSEHEFRACWYLYSQGKKKFNPNEASASNC